MTSPAFFYLLEKLNKLIFPLNLKRPYIICTVGIIGDYITSVIGLSVGCYERHPNYSPVNAIIFWMLVLSFLRLVFRKSRHREKIMSAFSICSLAGLINNLLVLGRLALC